MILAYISIMNDILLEIVMNSSIFKGEKIHLNQMVARGGKNIFNIFMYLIKNSLLQFYNLKAQYSTETGSQLTSKNNYKSKVKIVQDFIDVCINYLVLN